MNDAPQAGRWLVVLAGFIVAVHAWGLGFYGLAVFVAQLQKSYGWSAAFVSTATTVYYVAAALMLAATADLHARLGARGALLAGIGMLSAGAWLLARLAAPWQLIADVLLMAAGWSLISGTGITLTVAPWFAQRRGLALSLALTGASVAGFTLAPTMLWAIDRYGFAPATSVVIGCSALVASAAVLLLVRRPVTAGAHLRAPPQTGRIALLRQPAFRNLTACFAVAWLAQVGFLMHQVALLQPRLGVTLTGAAISLTTVCAVAGRLLLGFGIDRIEPRTAAAANFAVQMLAMVLLGVAPAGPAGVPWLLAGCALFGLSVGNAITLPPLVVQRDFAPEDFARVVGLTTSVCSLVSAFGPMALGTLVELTGSDRAAFALCGALEALAALLALGGRRSGTPAPSQPSRRSR